jgi:predicted alpha/beta-fold hydrolase
MFPHALGAHYSALLASLEHRYYGQSHPFERLTTENMKYLSSEQALIDIKTFLLHLHERRPFKKVLVIGCSYAGGLAGWFTENNGND